MKFETLYKQYKENPDKDWYEIVKNMEEPVTLEVTLTPYAFEMLCGGLYYDNDNYYKENPNKAVNELISEFGEYMVDQKACECLCL